MRVELTPTFLGCPALEAMRRALEETVTALGAEPEVAVIQDDSWSTDRISPAGREKLRAAGFAPPAPRAAGATTLVQLQSKAFRCPYCGSTDTRLENIFGPTPCRSIRWCDELPSAVRAVQDDLVADAPRHPQARRRGMSFARLRAA